MSLFQVEGRVERVSYVPSERRELLVLFRPDRAFPQGRYFEFCVDADIVCYYGAQMRLTQPGDLVVLEVLASPNGVHGLRKFMNHTLSNEMVMVEQERVARTAR